MGKVRRLIRDGCSRSGRQALERGLVTRLSQHVTPSLLEYHLAPEDVVTLPTLCHAGPAAPVKGPLRIGWVITPPSPGSGGHTTAFRMVKALEDAGHRCSLLLYDPFGGSADAHERTIRRHWPALGASVRPVTDGFAGLDACVATGWQTAHVLAKGTARMPIHRFYFIQDYEPFFYPMGFEAALAEQTYAFGFRNVALGEMVAGHLSSRGYACVSVPFGCDTETYRLTNRGHREGVACYVRQGTSRRGFLLAKMALEELHRRVPGLPIHVYGATASRTLDVPVIDHGRLSPRELNELYNRCAAGLALSFTNVSLVVGEMLAAGCVPVANDSADARAAEPSPFVRWAPATPTAIAEALLDVVEHPPSDVSDLAGSVLSSWTETGRCFVATIEQEARGCSSRST